MQRIHYKYRGRMVKSDVSLLVIIGMASSIKLFEFVQKIHQAIGIYPSSSDNLRSKIVKICAAQAVLTVLAYLLFEAQSMSDYGYGFCILISMIMANIVYLLFLWQSKKTSIFFANCEKFIEKSEYQSNVQHQITSVLDIFCNIFPLGAHSATAHQELTEKIELFPKCFCLTLLLIIGFCVSSALPYSFIRYYRFDMGEKSFYLFIPSWCVFSVKQN